MPLFRIVSGAISSELALPLPFIYIYIKLLTYLLTLLFVQLTGLESAVSSLSGILGEAAAANAFLIILTRENTSDV